MNIPKETVDQFVNEAMDKYITKDAQFQHVAQRAVEWTLQQLGAVDMEPDGAIEVYSGTNERGLPEYTYQDGYSATQLAAARLQCLKDYERLMESHIATLQRIAELEAQVELLLKERTAGVESANHRVDVRNQRIAELEAQLAHERSLVGKYMAQCNEQERSKQEPIMVHGFEAIHKEGGGTVLRPITRTIAAPVDQQAEIEAVRKANIDCMNHYNDARAEIERMREALEQTYVALLPHKSTVLRWYTPTDQAIDAARAALEKK
jgi:hypothetical protein